MRRTIVFAAVAVAALATAGLAVATLTASGVQQVSATFSAATVERSQTRSCTNDGDTYEITRARYTGSATQTGGDGSLTGPVVFHVESVYNVTDGIGWLAGQYQIRQGGDDRRAHGRFWAVNKGGALDGFLTGRVNRPGAGLLGSFSASWTKEAGLTNGQLGQGNSENLALLAGKPCTGKPYASAKLRVKGTFQSASATQIDVLPEGASQNVSCALDSSSPSTAGLQPGDRVHIECAGTPLVLKKLAKRGK